MQQRLSRLRTLRHGFKVIDRFGWLVAAASFVMLGATAASPVKQTGGAKTSDAANPFPSGRVLKYAASSPRALRNIRNFVTFQLEVAEKHDVSHLDRLMAPTMLIHTMGGASFEAWISGRTMGARQVPRDFFRNGDAFRNLRDHKRVIEEVYGIGDMVVGRWRTEGRGTGPLLGVQAAGRRVLMHETGFVRFDGQGRMVEGSFTTDAAEYLHSLGVAPPTLP